MATLPAWANLDFLVIESNPQYVANPDTGAIVVQPGWFQITTPEQLADVQKEIERLTPTPKPIAEWSDWKFDSRGDFRAVFSAVMVLDPFSATVLSGLITNTPDTDLNSLTIIWNEAISLIDTNAISSAFIAINECAITYHIPLRVNPNGVMELI